MSTNSSPCPELDPEIYNILKDIDLSPEEATIQKVSDVKRVLYFDEEFLIIPLSEDVDKNITTVNTNTLSSVSLDDTNEVVQGINIDKASTSIPNDGDDPNDVPDEKDASSSESPVRTKTRKRICNSQSWKCNERKRKRGSGEEYVNINGKTMKKGEEQGTCKPNCSFECMKKFDKEMRQQIHEQFWKLSDSKKSHYFSKYVPRQDPVRKRTKAENRRFSNVYLYNFELNSERTRVCKEFFLTTIDISQQRVYYFLKKVQNNITNVPRSPLKGKNVKKHTPLHKIEEIKTHINSFPVVESHYCRSSTKKNT